MIEANSNYINELKIYKDKLLQLNSLSNENKIVKITNCQNEKDKQSLSQELNELNDKVKYLKKELQNEQIKMKEAVVLIDSIKNENYELISKTNVKKYELRDFSCQTSEQDHSDLSSTNFKKIQIKNVPTNFESGSLDNALSKEHKKRSVNVIK